MDKFDLELDYPELQTELDLMAIIFMRHPKIAERIFSRIAVPEQQQKKRGRHARFEERMRQRYSDLRCFAAVWWYSEAEGLSCNRRRGKHEDSYPAYEAAARVVGLTPSTVKKAFLKVLRLIKENPTDLSAIFFGVMS